MFETHKSQTAKETERDDSKGHLMAVEQWMALNWKRIISRLNMKKKSFTVRLMRLWNRHRKCSGPGWMDLSATFLNGRGVGTRWYLRQCLPNQAILWFYDFPSAITEYLRWLIRGTVFFLLLPTSTISES